MQLIKPNWAAPAHVNAYSTTRVGGVSEQVYQGLNLGKHVGDNELHVEKNRQLLYQAVPTAPDFYWLNQTHSIDLIRLSDNTHHQVDGDASWLERGTKQTCVVMTADCLPVLVTDQKGSFVAAIHAGWRGLCDGIIENSIADICHELAINSNHLLVWLGPCIGPTAFEVGDDVREQFIVKDNNAEQAFIASGDKWLANLHLLAKLRLKHFPGITITESDLCTFNDDALFYSYRRDGKTGRLASFY